MDCLTDDDRLAGPPQQTWWKLGRPKRGRVFKLSAEIRKGRRQQVKDQQQHRVASTMENLSSWTFWRWQWPIKNRKSWRSKSSMGGRGCWRGGSVLCGSNDFLWVISEMLELEETKSAINSGEFLSRVQLLRKGGQQEMDGSFRLWHIRPKNGRSSKQTRTASYSGHNWTE